MLFTGSSGFINMIVYGSNNWKTILRGLNLYRERTDYKLMTEEGPYKKPKSAKYSKKSDKDNSFTNTKSDSNPFSKASPNSVSDDKPLISSTEISINGDNSNIEISSV